MNEIDITPGPTDRAVLMGRTGSGKTVLAMHLLASRRFVVVHDSKDKLFWPGYARYTELSALMQAPEPKLIYAPNHWEIDDLEKQELFFRWIYERKNTTLYVDEVYAVANANNIPHYYRACLTRGRQLGISTFSATQRPKRIPLEILSESEHYYVFSLLLPEDRDKVKNILPFDPNKLRELQAHQFFYGNANGEIIERPMKLRLNKAQIG
jgi:hypothetical protein